jgi:hypothetical protein
LLSRIRANDEFQNRTSSNVARAPAAHDQSFAQLALSGTVVCIGRNCLDKRGVGLLVHVGKACWTRHLQLWLELGVIET